MIVVVMGTSGPEKSAVGGELAKLLPADLMEGDDFQPNTNIVKMRSGIPLNDEDRWPWLKKLAAAVDAWVADGRDVVVTCSALRKSYRELLKGDNEDFHLVYLKGPDDIIYEPLEQSSGQSMSSNLPESQFDELEKDEGAIVVNSENDPADIATEIRKRLDLNGR